MQTFAVEFHLSYKGKSLEDTIATLHFDAETFADLFMQLQLGESDLSTKQRLVDAFAEVDVKFDSFAFGNIFNQVGELEFDAENPIKLVGTVKEVVWMNPHISVFVDVPQENGSIVTYEVQGGAPNSMYRRGSRKDDLLPGDPIIVEGPRARNEASMRVGQGNFMKLDGTEVW